MQTSSIASLPTQTPSGEPRHSFGAQSVREQSARANQSAFDAVFAQLAQFASVDASRNGKLSLGVGQRPAAGGGRAGARAALSEGVAQDAGAPRAGAEMSAAGGGSRLSDSIARAQRRGSQSQPGTLAGKAAATSGELSPGVVTGQSRSVGEAPLAAQGSAGGAGTGTGATSDTAPAGGSTQQAVVAGIAGNTGDLRGRLLGAPGQSAAVTAVGKAGTSAPGGGATTATNTNAIALGGRPNGATSSAMPSKAAAQNPATNNAKIMTAFRAQVAQGLSAALRQGRGDVMLRLTPKALGELRIELRAREGLVDARLRPATDEARGLLERSVDTLRHALEARGLRVGRIEIEQVPESKDGSLVRQQDQHPGSQDGRAGAEGEQGRHHPAEPGGGDGRGGAGVRHTAEDVSGNEGEGQNTTRMAGGPGVVYGVADGAARIVMVDALV